MPYSVVAKIRIVGLEFYGYHGVLDAERQVGHRFRADISATVPDSAVHADNLESTVDYAAMARLVVDVSSAGSFLTVEALVGRVGTEIMATFPIVSELNVRIAKLQPPVDLCLERAEVEAEFRR